MTDPRRQRVEGIRPIRTSTLSRSAFVLAADLSIYAALWAALLLAGPWWIKPPLALGAAVAITRLFLIGHDACHGVFFPAPRWFNAAFARLVFLPSLTPYSTWEVVHNTLHHGFTNLRGKDCFYAPFSPSEFDVLPGWRQRLERVYRHPLGPGLHYGIEIWWKRLWFPRDAERGIQHADSLLTLAFLALQLAIVVAVARATGQNALALAAWSVAAPFAVWHAIIGFVTYQQHTHPDVAWYADRRQWDPLTAQLRGTVHILFPPLAAALLGNFMDHTAHHLDAAIPMFELPEAQQRVEEAFRGEIVLARWTPAFYQECCRQCKLYDYHARRWAGFPSQ